MNSPSDAARSSHDWGFILRTAFAYLRRDWRAGELRVVALALVIAVSAVTSVSFFTKRVENALELRASSLLGGDLLLRQSAPLPDELQIQAHRSGLQTVRLVEFPSVVLGQGDETQLVAVKAVGRGYPLRGELTIRDTLDGDLRRAAQIPPRGEVWLDKRLFLLLDIQPEDSIALGDRQFIASKMIECKMGIQSPESPCHRTAKPEPKNTGHRKPGQIYFRKPRKPGQIYLIDKGTVVANH